MAEQAALPDFDTLWDYSKPAETRAKFEAILPQAESSGDESYHFQLLTQIARTHGLETNFDTAHAVLDRVEQAMAGDSGLVRVRYLLERGRTLRSSDKVAESRPLFEQSFELAKSLGEDFFAIDAAHMVAIAVEEPEEKRRWNLIGIDMAGKSRDQRAKNWRGSLCNNMGWDYHKAGEFEQALDMFQKALVAREDQGDEGSINIANWCIARCLRSLERHDEALTIQHTLEKRQHEMGEGDGYVFEELGELYLIKEDADKAAGYFAQAYALLSQDVWLQRNEAERLERMKKLGNVD